MDTFNKYRRVVFVVISILVVATAGVIGYNYVKNSSNEEAKSEIFLPAYFWEQDSLDLVIKGGKGSRSMPEIAEEYSGTKAGQLAYFYAGVAYLKKGKYQEAIDNLENFNCGDKLIQARAYSLLGDAYMELKDLDNAIRYYKKATKHYPNEYFTPRYYLKLALAYELNKENEAALKAYSAIVDNFPNSSDATDAKKNKLRIESILNQ